MNTLFVLLGPTGVGKSDVAITLAKHLGTPIINADSRQIFAELPIGTAAPTKEQLAEVKHYFVGNHHVTDYYSASMYEEEVMKLLSLPPAPSQGGGDADSQLLLTNSSVNNGIAPSPSLGGGWGEACGVFCSLLSGGSMMYIDAVCNGIDDIPTVDEKTRAWMKQRLNDEGLPALVEELKRLDPEHWKIVDRNNPRRVVHALEICHSTGRTYTSFRTHKAKKRPFRIVKIGLNRPREEMYDRINARVLKMIDEGLEQEALNVLPYRDLNALNTVGYKEMFNYLDGLLTLDEAIRQIQSNTRRYMRKQLTWFKKDDTIRWFNAEDIDGILTFVDSCLKV